MNLPIAIPAHVGNDGIWITFISPATGKQSAISFGALMDKFGGGIVGAAMQEWADAQIAAHATHSSTSAMDGFWLTGGMKCSCGSSTAIRSRRPMGLVASR